MSSSLLDLILETQELSQTPYLYGFARTTEDATQNSLDDERVYNSKVVAPEQVKLTELAKAS